MRTRHAMCTVLPRHQHEAGSKHSQATVADTASLLAVSVLWSTYSPALRYLYMLPGPPTPVALTATTAVLQAACLVPLALFQGLSSARRSARQDDSSLADGAASETLLTPQFLRATAELGLLEVAATAFQAVGLETTTATNGAFIIQTTAVFTPLLVSLGGGFISRRVWVATSLGAAGTLLFVLGSHSADPMGTGFSGGDVAVLGAALSYSLTTVRIGFHASRLRPVQLALAKSAGLAVLAAGWACVIGAMTAVKGQPLSRLWEGYQNSMAWGVLLFVAVSGAAAAVLQSRGQAAVPPERAQLLYSTTPLWSTAIAVFVLHEAALTAEEVAGGGLIIFASLLASVRK